MSVSTSQRLPRERVLLFVALILVGGISIPLWQYFNPNQNSGEFWQKWTPNRIANLLLGPEQIACYLCFVWAGLMLLNRRTEVIRQRAAFKLDLLPTEEGARILPEDARPLSRKIEQITSQRGPYILSSMIRLALGKYAISKSAPDVGEVLRTQADVEQSRLITSMGTINYLTWAIPAIGFLGTVRGLAGGLGTDTTLENKAFIAQVKAQLSIAFDCTFVALTLSVVLMYLLYMVQKAEELLIIDAQAYCQEHLLLRLYDPEPVSSDRGEYR